MKQPLEIIVEIKNFISNNNPFRFPYQEETVLNLLSELENELNPQPVVESIVEESIVEEILEVTILEPVVIEEVVEEVIVEEVVTPKKTTRKK